MTRLHLIRHGQTEWNAIGKCQGQSDSELDDTGRAQADALRPHINTLGIKAVYSSSSLRTRQTTEILARNIELPVTTMDELMEIGLGDWETRMWEDLEQEDPDGVAAFRTAPEKFDKPGAETYYDVRERGVAAFESIFAREPEGDVLVVSHGLMLRAALSHYAGVEMDQLRAVPGFGNCSHSILESIPAANGSLTNRRLIQVAGTPFEETGWA